MLITFERKVPQSSYTSQNDHKSKGYPSKTSAAAFTVQKSDKCDLRCLEHPPLKQTSKNPTFWLQYVSFFLCIFCPLFPYVSLSKLLLVVPGPLSVFFFIGTDVFLSLYFVSSELCKIVCRVKRKVGFPSPGLNIINIY